MGGLSHSVCNAWSGRKEYFGPPLMEGRSTWNKSFALSMVDPHPVAQNWVHWLVISIPADVISFEEGASGKKLPPGSVELKNSSGDIGYGGPQPPKGKATILMCSASMP